MTTAAATIAVRIPFLGVDKLRELLSYDPDTGAFVWLQDRTIRTRAGDVAGYTHRGYRSIMIDGRNYLAHRLAWLHFYGVWPTADIDHIDGAPENNRIINLRLATAAQNMRNSKVRKHNVSGLKGAHFSKTIGRWTSSITVDGRVIYLGCFKSPEEAHAAYTAASQQHHGEFGRTT